MLHTSNAVQNLIFPAFLKDFDAKIKTNEAKKYINFAFPKPFDDTKTLVQHPRKLAKNKF